VGVDVDVDVEPVVSIPSVEWRGTGTDKYEVEEAAVLVGLYSDDEAESPPIARLIGVSSCKSAVDAGDSTGWRSLPIRLLRSGVGSDPFFSTLLCFPVGRKWPRLRDRGGVDIDFPFIAMLGVELPLGIGCLALSSETERTGNDVVESWCREWT
jgi:hypothetical protein